MITLPENLFSQGNNSKAIFVLQKKGSKTVEPFVYPLNSLRDSQELADFKEKISNLESIFMKFELRFDIIVENA